MTKRALISVSDKNGSVELAESLSKLGFEIISTGGTKKALDEAGIATLAIEEVTHFPEMMDGRVKYKSNDSWRTFGTTILDSHLSLP